MIAPKVVGRVVPNPRLFSSKGKAGTAYLNGSALRLI